jgi:hypothetical protein
VHYLKQKNVFPGPCQHTGKVGILSILPHQRVYPGEEAIVAFAEELSEYSVSKGTIRVPYDKPLPTELIEKIARWCYKKYSRQTYGKMP